MAPANLNLADIESLKADFASNDKRWRQSNRPPRLLLHIRWGKWMTHNHYPCPHRNINLAAPSRSNVESFKVRTKILSQGGHPEMRRLPLKSTGHLSRRNMDQHLDADHKPWCR